MKRTAALFAILLIHAGLWFALKPAVLNSDDQCYIDEGNRLFSDEYTISDSPKSQRFTVIIPIKIFIELSGFNPFSVALWPLLCSLMTIAGLYFLVRLNDEPLAGLSALLLSVNIIQVIYSAVAFPDVVVSFFAFMATALAALRNEKGWTLPVMIVVSLTAGFFAKQIIVFILPFLVWLAVDDWLKKSHRRFWKKFFLLCVAAVAVWLFLSEKLTGDFLFFLDSIERNHNAVFARYTGTELFYRLTIEPFIFLFHQLGLWPLMLMAWPAWFIADERLPFWRAYAVILLVMLWFFTTSFSGWSPLPLLDRMWMMMLVPLSVLAGATIRNIVRNELRPAIVRILYLGFLVSALIAFFAVSPLRSLLFLSFPIMLYLSGTPVFKKQKSLWGYALALTPFVVLCLWFTATNSRW